MAALDEIGGEIAVTPPDTPDEFSPTVTALSGGRTLIAWTQDVTGEYSRDLYAQIYGADGAPEGDPFVISRAPYEQIEIDVTGLADGGFIATWRTQTEPIGGARRFDVQAARFDASGDRVGREFTVPDDASGQQGSPQVAVLANGRYVITWDELGGHSGDMSGAGVRAQLFAANGRRLGSTIDVNTTTAENQAAPTIAALADGGYAIAWAGTIGPGRDARGTVSLQLFAANGARRGGEVVVSTGLPLATDPSLAVLADGSLALAYASYDPVAGTSEIYVSHVTARGALLGPPAQVNTVTDGLQLAPTIAATDSGGFVVAWTDFSGTGGDESQTSVKAQAYGADGARIGDAILVNTATHWDQAAPSIATLSDGRIAIVWNDITQPVDGFSDLRIRGQFYSEAPPPQVHLGSAAADTFAAPDARDWRIDGLAGDDRLSGADGDDILIGGRGRDVLTGGAGGDRFEIDARAGADVFHGGDGVDVIRAVADGVTIGIASIDGVERIDASGFAGVAIAGDNGDNVLDFSQVELLSIVAIGGGKGADTITGTDGSDVIAGGLGRDVLAGGAGFDRFEGTMAEWRGDTILDFSSQDRLFIADFGGDSQTATFAFRGDRLFFDPDGAGARDAVVITLAGFDPGHGYSYSLDSAGALTFTVF